MRNLTVIPVVSLVVALLGFASSKSSAQTSQSARAQASSFKLDASAIFELLTGQASVGFLGMKEGFERTVAESQLTKADGGDALGTTWSRWVGENASGRVSAYGSFPGAMDATHNRFWVSFEPATELSIPEALLAHLLAKAARTSVTSGDTVDVTLPHEQLLGGCVVHYTLRVRMTGGALVRNTAEYSCPASGK